MSKKEYYRLDKILSILNKENLSRNQIQNLIEQNYVYVNNKIEKAFLENIIRAETPEIPEGMLPKSFPSEHTNGLYIPNWGMWFVVELYDYLRRTGDYALIEKAKDKVYRLVHFFDKYENEYGLLENLESWIKTEF